MKFQVEGMNCMSCVRNIDEALKEFDQKLSVSADIKGKTVSVETTYPADQIKKLIEEAGYQVKILGQ